MNSIIRITPTGEIVAIKNAVAEKILTDEFGQLQTRRASHVLPVQPAKRMAFRFLRWVFGERGKIAEWQRRWRGPWQVSWAETPQQVEFKHKSRRACIQWEISMLNRKLINN